MIDLTLLENWIQQHLPSSSRLTEPMLLDQINSDAGFRQYFRVNSDPTLIAVLSPSSSENNTSFVRLSQCFRKNHIRVPLVHAVDYSSGFLLLEDFGDNLLASSLVSKHAKKFYASAETELIKIQQIPKNESKCPVYDRELLMAEMDLFREWFLNRLIKIDLEESDNQLLDQAFSVIVESALQQTQVVVHRDFHSRNLMRLPDNSVGVIDYQDALIGPLTYDVVSLYRDCYIRLPENWVIQKSLDYYRRAEKLGIAPSASDKEIITWLDLMGLQRHIKVLGIFSRLHLRDGKHDYLNDLPLVIRYILEQLRPYPKLFNFLEWFECKILPKVSSQSWYKPWEEAGDSEIQSNEGFKL